jgi:hypothetical protein
MSIIWTQEDEDVFAAEQARHYEESVKWAEEVGFPVRMLAKPNPPENLAANAARRQSRGVSRKGWHRRGKRVGEFG